VRIRARGAASWLSFAALAMAAPRTLAAQTDFFHSRDVFVMTLRTDLRSLLRERDTANAPWHAATIRFAGPDSAVSVPLRVRTRGMFRLQHCDFPPIRLRFEQDSARGTPFSHLRRPKLATHCMDRTEFEQNLLQEYAIYRVLQLFTPLSHEIRLVRVTYEDAAGSVRPVTRYGFITEDPERLAERLHAALVPSRGVAMRDLLPGEAALLGLFQYFIANTDWSLPGLHNIEVLRMGDTLHAVPYDFDWSGVIDARYARPDSRLRIRSVRERLFRGLCQPAEVLEPVLARFEALRDSIAAVYREVPDLDQRIIERSSRYHDEFFHEIADRRRFVSQAVTPDCRR
jgi:hypothetical protein